MTTASTTLLRSRLRKLHEELTDRAQYRATYGEGVMGGSSAQQDRSAVPASLIPQLNSVAQRIGFPVRYGDTSEKLDANSIGVTDFLSQDITIRRGMSAASTARTTCHELGHALSGWPSPTFNGTLEELSAESTAALVSHGLGITDGRFSQDFLHSFARDLPYPQHGLVAVRDLAVEHAATILEHVGAAA